MKLKNIFILLLTVSGLIILYYSLMNSGTDESYRAEIIKERKNKDDFMRNSSESPFAGTKEAAHPLNYFDVDEQYRIVADLIPIEEKQAVTLTTSDGKEQHYLKYAFADFSLEGKKCRLLILEVMAMGPFRGTLFLAFADATSAKESYGAGRYLDLKKVPGSSTITLDFNKAYNPYCAYNDNFSCPFPPVENVLEVAIKAGEKSYH